MDLHRLAGRLGKDTVGPRLRWGVVDAVNADMVDITIGGSSVVIPDVRHLASYSPTEGDTVAMLIDGQDVLVLGDLA